MQGEAIYKGATRPAMKLGIPLVPLVVLFGTGMLLIMWGGTLVSWWIALGVVVAFVPALLWMRFVTSKDDQRFRQMFVAMKLRLHDRNRPTWWIAFFLVPVLIKTAKDTLIITDDPLQSSVLDYALNALILAVGCWFFIELGLLCGTPGPNRHGPNPLKGA